MLDGTDPRLIYEWQAYYDMEPFGEERADIRNAINCLATAQAMGMKKQGGKLSIKDFMPEFDKQEQKATVDPQSAKEILRKRYGNNS